MATARERMSKTNPLKRDGKKMPTLADMTGAMLKKKDVDIPSSLVEVDESTLQYGRVQLTAVGLSIPDNLTEDEWYQMGLFLLRTDTSFKWWAGDFINYGENRKWGETYARLATQFEMGIKALYNIALVCRKVEFSRRRENLSFSHHQAVAALEPEQQTYFLDLSVQNGWTMRQLREAVKGKKTPTLSGYVRRFRKSMAKNREMLIDSLEMLDQIGQGDVDTVVSVIDEEIEALLAIKRGLGG